MPRWALQQRSQHRRRMDEARRLIRCCAWLTCLQCGISADDRRPYLHNQNAANNAGGRSGDLVIGTIVRRDLDRHLTKAQRELYCATPSVLRTTHTCCSAAGLRATRTLAQLFTCAITRDLHTSPLAHQHSFHYRTYVHCTRPSPSSTQRSKQLKRTVSCQAKRNTTDPNCWTLRHPVSTACSVSSAKSWPQLQHKRPF